jgi:hypothetical protein
MSTKTPTMSSSDFNLEKLTTKELSNHVSSTIQIGGNIAVFGRRGTGKTEISKAQIKKLDMHEVYINLSVMERVDLGGYPDIMGRASNPDEKRRKFVEFLLPQFYQPMIEGKKGVVALLDELDKADPSLWAPLLEFIQFRSINGTPLPNLHAIITTGNLLSEGGNRPSPPLLDRMEKYLVEADATSWLQWAGKSGHIHPSVTAFISDHPKELFGDVDPQDRYADPSPRGWHRASEIIFKGEERGWDSDLLNKKVCGCIGKSAGITYSNYFAYYQQLLPMIDRAYQGQSILEEYNALEPTQKLVACMITCARLATHMDQASATNPPPALRHVGRFLQNVSYENILVAVRSQIQIDRIVKYTLDDNPDWSSILSKVNKSVDC